MAKILSIIYQVEIVLINNVSWGSVPFVQEISKAGSDLCLSFLKPAFFARLRNP
jgi:hypothetical protein